MKHVTVLVVDEMRSKVDNVAEDDEDNESNKQGHEGFFTTNSEHEGKYWHCEENLASYKSLLSFCKQIKNVRLNIIGGW